MKTLKSSRRSFLKVAAKLGLGASVIDSLAMNILNKAFADTVGAKLADIHYVGISLAGGLPRWQFDLPLRPTSSSAFSAGTFGTAIEALGSTYKAKYVTKTFTAVGGKKLNVAPVWFMDVDGKKLTDLLNNIAMIRGVDMEINSHPVSNARQEATNIGGYSIGGVVADVTGRPLPAVVDPTISSGSVFRSAKSMSSVNANLNAANPAQALLRAFQRLPAAATYSGADWKTARDQAHAKFSEYAIQAGLPSSSLADAYSHAEDLIKKDTYSLSDSYSAIVAKYDNIVKAAIFPTIGSFVEYFPNIITVDNTLPGFSIDRTAKLKNGINLWDVLKSDKLAPENLAKDFALVELLMNNGLSSSFAIGSSSFLGLNTGTGTFNLGHDHHFVGEVCETLITTLYYRALLGCLREFKDAIGTKFNKTVIQIAAEWNRSPAIDGHGSDHGVTGSNVSIISGMIKGPIALGNILTNSGMSAYPGTWGVAAPWTFDDGVTRPFVRTDVTRTITSLLGVQDIVNNGYPLLAPDGTGQWVAKKEGATNG